MKTMPLLAGLIALAIPATICAADARPEPERLKSTIEKLVSFGTRHTLSSPDDPKRGIGAARRWAASEFSKISKSCGGCIQVETVEKVFTGPRAPDGAKIVDVLAIKPGKMGWKHVIIVAGHIDSRVTDVMNFTDDAPGANDDGSGSALVMEAARVIAADPQGEATIIFALLSGEEQGLFGGKLLADTAKERGWQVSAMLNNDIVGNSIRTDGKVVDDRVRIFSEGIRASEDMAGQLARRGSGGEDDGPSRALMRVPLGISRNRPDIGLSVLAVRRPDRFSRGGDHLPALELGYPAIRFTVGAENYDAQHQDLRTENGKVYGDTVDRMDFDYLAKVTALNIATMRELGNAPPAPQSATLAGALGSDTTISWTPVDGADHYLVYVRSADQTDWQRSIRSDTLELLVKDTVVDDNFFGVAAVSKSGEQSIVTFAGLPPRK